MSEDNIIGQIIFEQHQRHIIASDMAFQPLGNITLKEYLKRRSRWIRIRKYSNAGATMMEPFTESIFCGILAGLGMKHLFQVSFWGFFGLHLLCWYVGDLILTNLLEPTVMEDVGIYTIGWIFREITALPVYVFAYAGALVEWRGTKFKLYDDGTAHPVDLSALPPGLRQRLKLAAAKAASKASSSGSEKKEKTVPSAPFGHYVWVVMISFLGVILFSLGVLVEVLMEGRSVIDVGKPSFESSASASSPTKSGKKRASLSPSSSISPSSSKSSPNSQKRERIWVLIASFVSGRDLSGQSLSVSDAWQTMFLAIQVKMKPDRPDVTASANPLSPISPTSPSSSLATESEWIPSTLTSTTSATEGLKQRKL
jgi:hypothetical protein